jgi:two-component system, NarL family, response regulator NreC
MTIRILIADDHGLIRAGLRSILEDEPAIEVVGEALDGDEAILLASRHSPDIILLDIAMPGMDGIETTRRLKVVLPDIRIIILTVYEDESLLKEAIKAGAVGYIIKRALEDELIQAIQCVSRGEMYIHPSLMSQLSRADSPPVKSEKNSLEMLTPREYEIMGYIVRGYTNRQIAENLYLSVRTIEGHRANLLSKLGLNNRVELVEFAEKHGLFER